MTIAPAERQHPSRMFAGDVIFPDLSKGEDSR
jgi:hypothetical protein